MSLTFTTRHNWERPFTVTVDGRSVCITDNVNKSHIQVKVKRTLVGESFENETTKACGAYGPEYDGNTMLLHLENDKYLFIGNCLIEFSAKKQIIHFSSPVSNNDVPYPYAVDADRNIYLPYDNAIIIGIDDENILSKEFDAYADYYYDLCALTPDLGFIQSVPPVLHLTFYQNDKPRTMYWNAHPFEDREKGPMHLSLVIDGVEGPKQPLSEDTYLRIMDECAKKNGLEILGARKVLELTKL